VFKEDFAVDAGVERSGFTAIVVMCQVEQNLLIFTITHFA
jgi:hypothetical protein